MATRNKGKDNVNIHQGHRQRVRDRIATAGFDSLPDHEYLEYLLFHAIPRRDVNPLAHELLNTFNDIRGLFSAYESDFRKHTRLSDSTIDYIVNYGDLVKEYIESRKRVLELSTIEGRVEFTKNLIGMEREVLVVLLTDNTDSFVMYREFSLENGFEYNLKHEVLSYLISAEALRATIVGIIPSFDNVAYHYNPFYKYSEENIRDFCDSISNYTQTFAVDYDGFVIARKIFRSDYEIYTF